jgi:hypothetical protein
MRFFLKGLNPLKIQTKFKCSLFLDIKFKFCCEFELVPNRKVVHFEVIYHHAMFENYWTIGHTTFVVYNLEVV